MKKIIFFMVMSTCFMYSCSNINGEESLDIQENTIADIQLQINEAKLIEAEKIVKEILESEMLEQKRIELEIAEKELIETKRIELEIAKKELEKKQQEEASMEQYIELLKIEQENIKKGIYPGE